MDKRVVIISASLRKNSNSEQLAEAFAKGAASAGNHISGQEENGVLYRMPVLSEDIPLLYAG